MSNYKLYSWLVLFWAFGSVSLADTPASDQWMQLMQYQKTGSGYRSKILASGFFISPDGATDPTAELQASLAFFQKILPSGSSHPQCVFPARYRVLKRQFALAPPVSCDEYDKWKAGYQVSYVSLFYAGPYLSSPSSVFGHSFLLLGSDRVEEFSQMTFNYAADIPNETSAFTYASKGLTGGFPGVISIVPFYERLYQYTDMENRDLWEYRLNLNAEQVSLLSDYIWEIKNQVQFDYYFLDENCASILLWILKAVRPETNIETSNGIYISPSEVTQVVAREQLVQQVIFHPSLLKRLNSKINRMTTAEKNQFQLLQSQRTVSGTSALFLEAAMDHFNIQRHRASGELAAELKPAEHAVLLQRSKIQNVPVTFNPEEMPLEPHTAHPPVRLQAGLSFREGVAGLSFSLRPGVHDLLDYDGGYLPYSSIRILEFEIEAPDFKKPRLQKLTFLDLTNLPAVGFYENPLSWSVEVQGRQNDFDQLNDRLFFEARVGLGYSTELQSKDFLLYALFSSAVRTNQGRPLGDFDFGPVAGLIYSGKAFKWSTSMAHMWPSGPEQLNFLKLNSEISYRLNSAWSAFAGYSLLQDKEQNFKSELSKVAVEYYF